VKKHRFLLALPLLLAVAAGGMGVFALRSFSPVAGSERSILFRVQPGASLGTVARDLERERLVRHAWAFGTLARWRGLAGELRAGEYDLSPHLTTREILERIAEGQVRTYRIVIPEGLAAAEIAHRLEENGLANAEEFLAACAGIRRGAILCGHVHRRFRVRTPGVVPEIFCAGSATLANREGLWVFDVDRAGQAAEATPGHWTGARYELDVSPSQGQVFVDRSGPPVSNP